MRNRADYKHEPLVQRGSRYQHRKLVFHTDRQAQPKALQSQGGFLGDDNKPTFYRSALSLTKTVIGAGAVA